jgi:DNA-binding MarR family transcriptional regulator
VLSLVSHNPGITSRQLCAALDVMPPNLVGLIAALERRKLIERRPHPTDRRAVGVHLTPAGAELTAQAEKTAAQLEMDATYRLTDAERKTLIRLLQKIYTGPAPGRQAGRQPGLVPLLVPAFRPSPTHRPDRTGGLLLPVPFCAPCVPGARPAHRAGIKGKSQ